MNVKIDTKEKFHVITWEEAEIPANMTEELGNFLLPYLKMEVKNVVLNVSQVSSIHEAAAQGLVLAIHQNLSAWQRDVMDRVGHVASHQKIGWSAPLPPIASSVERASEQRDSVMDSVAG